MTRLRLERNRTVAARIEHTFLLLIASGFFLMFTALAFAPQLKGWWQVPVRVAVEICWLFWILAMFYVWFQPRWLTRAYIYAERKMLTVLLLALLIGVVLLVVIL